MAVLNGGVLPVEIAPGFTITAPGLVGTADVLGPRAPGTRGPEVATPAFDTALENAALRESVTIEVAASPQVGSAAAMRGPDGAAAFEVTTPDFGAETGQVILTIDENGAMTWQYPLDDQGHVQPPSVRSGGPGKRYLIRREVTPGIQAPSQGRGLVSSIGKKLLKVLIYPMTDPILGRISTNFADRWEEMNRPYGMRLFTPADYQEPIGQAIDANEWARLASGRSLLFIHGTFSTAHGAFKDLPVDDMRALHAAYGQRTFAFNHLTLSQDPRRNVEWLLAQVPAAISLDVDIISHSRGGLVARVLTERPSVFGLDTERIRVGRTVFVGVPNNGTLLAHPDHMAHMLDRMTTILNLFPSGIITEVLESIITAVKVVAHGALRGLEGLASMQPNGKFLKELNAAATTEALYYSISADYGPEDPGLKQLVADEVMDRVFRDAANDLVVPEHGVYEPNGSVRFPLDQASRLQMDRSTNVMHTTFFGNATVASQIRNWLQA